MYLVGGGSCGFCIFGGVYLDHGPFETRAFPIFSETFVYRTEKEPAQLPPHSDLYRFVYLVCVCACVSV